MSGSGSARAEPTAKVRPSGVGIVSFAELRGGAHGPTTPGAKRIPYDGVRPVA